MAKNTMELLEETEKLNTENVALHQRLREAEEYIDAIKTGNIDALVIPHEKEVIVYTDKSADKPYRLLIEKMHEGAVTVNESGTILYCNSYFAGMVNLPLQKVIGTIFENFIDNSSEEHIENFFKQGSTDALKEEILIHASNGKVIPVLMTVNSLSLDNILVLSIVLTDLTLQNENKEKLKRRTEQLEQKNMELESVIKELAFQNEEKEKRAAELIIANKELAFQNEEKEKRADELIITNKDLAFQIEEKEKRGAELTIAKTDVKELEGLNTHKESILATLSHDLRSPLAGIIGASEMLKENFDSLENSKIKEMLDLLHKASTDELRMLDYLVEWARIKYASEAFSPEKIDLVRYVNKVLDTLNDNAVAKNLHLYNEIRKSICVYADGKMLLSILQNLVSNSIKHTHEGGKITVTAKRKEDKIIIEIKDTGIGMSKEIRKKLFTPQMISLSNAREENKGAGIGLLLVKGFLEKNGGEIWVESKEGVGSSFFFTLPVNKPATM
jgi:PAS domain S-box-containing protein